MHRPRLHVPDDEPITFEMADDFDYRELVGRLEAGSPTARVAAQVIRSLSGVLRRFDKKLAEPDHELVVEIPSPPEFFPVPMAQIRSIRDWRIYLADPLAFGAKREAVDTDQYRRWVMSDGWPHCGATGIDGKRCRNVTSGAKPVGVREFLRLDGKPCRDHGGKPWQVIPETEGLSFRAVPTQPPKENFMTPHDLNDEQINLIKQYQGDVAGLVAAASDVSSPLHDLFDWSSTDLAAADARRVAAEQLLASVAEPPADPVTGEPTTESEGAPGEAAAEDVDQVEDDAKSEANTEGATEGDEHKSPLNEAVPGDAGGQ